MSSFNLDNRTYDSLKWVAQIFLPALGTLYFALSGLWGLPNPNEVVGSIVAIDAFIGALLGLSSIGYQPKVDGVVSVDPVSKHVVAGMTTPARDAIDNGTVTLKVKEIK